ncbi:YafY family protein [Hyphomonas sp. FCG-A18]|uniref:helix-turn-helix transcriptional regulator n=1 Tax=Hyphomonas sp. FCG-A18 TaxID=3080019 RepID=UPI002B3080FF|nr:YafY family protein [Hyphomonas sp. FCG-A18]
MRRTDRLFELIQLFRGGRLWRGQELADRLEVSLRTIYRDIDSLVASGIAIEGERGVGYLLREPIFLPPLTLTPLELEAFHLGMALVRASADAALGEASDALALKINEVLPTDRQQANFRKSMSVYIKPTQHDYAVQAQLREAINTRRKALIFYNSLKRVRSERIIWPLHLEFWGSVWTLTAWCEHRADFRTFRADRVGSITLLKDTFRPEPGKTYQDFLQAMENK